MTVEKCIAFCKDQDFIFAGVEFGQECYCDSTIQFPGSLAPEPTDCSQGFACTGNSSETCGARGRIEIFTNGGQAPVLVENVPNSAWAYQGCFTDSAASRVLATPMAVPVGVTAETCTAACQTAGFTDAGLEDGRECWCDNTLGTTSTHVSDLDCRAVCVANHTEYCGNANRIALYHLFDDDGSGSGGGGGGAQNECVAQDMSNFTLVARFNTPPSNGAPQEIPLKVLLVEMVPSVTWTVLSVSFYD
ncbi:WSC-domain-containing protein [Dendrothele bispora CBS 962.96]|uniref:WSC-domain-containing protein n=1 Tax=Dendrothele bispora (strain CBS 962.96) TaxID=1314807 RepID=A0A4S8LS41_DENBC|nr:WSC-domain-containing protein [Dendrothele bispora CBS 962.96]